MAKKALLICLDGCAPEYLRLGGASFLHRVGVEGTHVEGDSMIPSVTNVNNVSILTGSYPERHGLTSNYYFDRQTGREVYMESPRFIREESILERLAGRGLKTALLTSKDKLRRLLNRGASISFSAERPVPWVTEKIGSAPNIYSADVDIWLMKALREVMAEEKPDFAYVATTDYTMHKYPPGHPESRRHISGVDRAIQETVEYLEMEGEEVLLCVTADHGMSEKERAGNRERTLRRAGIRSHMNTIIADRYVVHHSNMGGSVYIYLQDTDTLRVAAETLEAAEGVEEVLTREDASNLYHLDVERIGDLLVLGRKNFVFGLIDQEAEDVTLRSHGSLYERRVPIIVNQPGLGERLRENKDLFHVVEDWLAE